MYIGNDLQIAHPSYKIIDDISSGFNGSTTSFALQVSGATPVPFPISTQQVMISVNGVVQEPDPTGSAGFKLLGSNIVFSSAPANGHAIFGVINAGADYVTAGSEFPDGSATAPSFTFQDDQDTGWFRSGSGAVGYSANGAQTLTFDGNGLTVTGDASFVGDSSKNLLWDKSDGALEFADNAKATFGTGSDLEIFHSGSNAHINHVTSGNMFIDAVGDITFRNTAGTENRAKFANNGAVELYYDNEKMFQTNGDGCEFFDSDNNCNVYFNCNGTRRGYLFVDSTGGGKMAFMDNQNHPMLEATKNGAVDLYYDNVKQVETTASGLKITSGGGGGLSIENDQGTNAACINLKQLQSGQEREYRIAVGGSTGSYAQSKALFIRDQTGGATRVEVRETGDVKVNENILLDDAKKIKLGAGTDFELFHDGTHNKIECSNGQLHIKASQVDFINAAGSEYMLRASQDGAVTFYHDNHNVAETDAAGLEIGRTNSTNAYITMRTSAGTAGFLYADSNTDIYLMDREGHSLFRGTKDGQVRLFYDHVEKLSTTSTGVTVTGTVSDSKGDLRKIIKNTKASAYVAVASDAGKCIFISSGGVTINNNVFSDGEAVTIVNNSTSDQTITQGSGLTMHNAADASSGNRTLAGRGMATIWFHEAAECYISGAGLS